MENLNDTLDKIFKQNIDEINSSKILHLNNNESNDNPDNVTVSKITTKSEINSSSEVNKIDLTTLQISETDLSPFDSKQNIYGKVEIKNSDKVLVKNVTYVAGPVIVDKAITNVEQSIETNQIVLNNNDCNDLPNANAEEFSIISRQEWLARTPLSRPVLPNPVKYVIIEHTASEERYEKEGNISLMQLVQNFHMDSREWDDIGYNFVIGCDGNVYEGRGWNIQGAHTYGYNQYSLGIAFIGCFMYHLPPVSALNAAKALIQKGVDLGYIPKDYILVGHCQCIATESPGSHVYNEIKTWPNWKELTPEEDKTGPFKLI